MTKIKIILSIFLLTLSVNLFSQYSISFRLVTSSGTPLTGQAANIVWTKYPHSFGTDDISGLTTTEIGTAGNYKTTGFTTYQHAKLWLSGVEQTWLDSVQTGNILSYLSTYYIHRTSAVTGITGNKTISSGDWLKLAGTETWSKPYIYSGSAWISDYSLLSGYSLVWQDYADSIYGIKPWYYDGSDKVRLNTGFKLYGRTNSTSPININTSHFSYSSDMLSINTSALYNDSIGIRKDTIISEATFSKLWTIKRRFWSQIDSSTVYMYYKNTYANTQDSFAVINNALSVDNETSISLQYDGTYTKIDSLYLQPGKYTINFAVLWERPNHNNIAQMNVSDTVIVALKEQSSAPNSYIVTSIRDIETYADTTNFSGGVLQWSTVHTVYSTAKYVYLYGRYVANALSTALGLGPTASVKRGTINATLIR